MDEKPARAWLWYFIGMWALIASALIMLGTGTAHTQERTLCAPAEIMLRQFSEIHKERPVWGGIIPLETGPVEAILLQSEKNTWTFLTIQDGRACVLTFGQDANPSLAGKGV